VCARGQKKITGSRGKGRHLTNWETNIQKMSFLGLGRLGGGGRKDEQKERGVAITCPAPSGVPSAKKKKKKEKARIWRQPRTEGGGGFWKRNVNINKGEKK